MGSIALAGFLGCIAGLTLAWAIWFFWPRPPWWSAAGPFAFEFQSPAPCIMYEYDHLRLLAGVDTALSKSEITLASLNRESPKKSSTDLKMEFLGSR